MIRKFRKGDEEAWCKVREENLVKINSKHYPEEIIRILLSRNKPRRVLRKSRNHTMLVYEKNKEIVGTISLTQDGEIKNLFVKPEFHGNGVGKTLLQKAEETAVKQGLKKIFLYASVNAQKFYENNGYIKEHDEVEEINGKEYHLKFMTKKL